MRMTKNALAKHQQLQDSIRKSFANNDPISFNITLKYWAELRHSEIIFNHVWIFVVLQTQNIFFDKLRDV